MLPLGGATILLFVESQTLFMLVAEIMPFILCPGADVPLLQSLQFDFTVVSL